MSSTLSDRKQFIFASRITPPPSTWAPAAYTLNMGDLPPLPDIRTPKLSKQAVTTKDLLIHQDYMNGDNQGCEVASYRPLEWLGDGKLHQVYTESLYRLLPGVGSGILSTLRERLGANTTHAHVAWAYEFDIRILEPPHPSQPRKGWQPLSRAQNIIADLFEAHIGALVEEGRQAEVERWVNDLLEKIKVNLVKQAEEMTAEARDKNKESRGDKKKRKAEENVFDRGWELDPLTRRRRTSLLVNCPAVPLPLRKIPLCRWDDRTDADGQWHSHLISDNTTIACGRGKKQTQAHDSATANLVESLNSDPTFCTEITKGIRL
ncbi:hypothetical protein JCM5350_003853 [Sporobolomyces pararoseus]